MNSWMSRLLLACAPPLMMFIIGTGMLIGPAAAEVAVERQAGFFGRRLGHRHRDGQHGVGAEARLVVGAVQFDQGLVDEGLLLGIEADDGFGDFGVDVLDGLAARPCRGSAPCRRRAVRWLRARRSRRRTARRRGPSRRIRAGHRLRRWDCRGNPEFRGRRHQRWHSFVFPFSVKQYLLHVHLRKTLPLHRRHRAPSASVKQSLPSAPAARHSGRPTAPWPDRDAFP